ncbi:transcriptional repressor [Schaalia sp. 19OD2882]|uniref:Fur family transcriptional regulator n=1 Tax=Schaalia sp. 19OD2882 TaxID=2794089 RepID=UPI001C1EAD1A|nr:transcriptional repressor [Schaalia sp. 19OD2882]QWW20711.1 transcriptional repressor [Schaalia sp. 19OD2882]
MQRMTKQRQAVLDELERVRDFRSAQQVYEDLVGQGQRVGLATVYRNLQTLAEDGRLDVLRSAEGESLYRSCGNSDHHHHLVCRNCGHAEEISLDQFEPWVSTVAAEHHFTEVEHSIELFGLCRPCTEDLANASH